MKKNDLTVEETYKKYTPYEHILHRPDTYVGSLEFQKERLWVYNTEEDCLEQRDISYVPGLFKIFDEIIVNAADNYQNDKTMKYIKVNIDQEKGIIQVKNGGRGIPITIHKDYDIYVPELIFGNLLTSSNYNDEQKKVTGGRNGYGAKLANIFSKKFIVETADRSTKKYYKQVFTNNMLNKTKPEITSYKDEDFTCITFEPDLKKFKMESLDEDIVSVFKKRIYDLAGITPRSVSVYLNETKLTVKDFSSYIDMYLAASKEEDEEDPPKVFESPNNRWEIGMSLSESQFQQVSFVNSISTSKGGTHVNYVTEKIVSAILDEVKKKNKTVTIKPQHVKQHLWIFVNCLVDNPAFDSQTKETLNTKKDEFGSSFEFSEGFIKKVIKTGIVERCLRYAKTREEEACLRKLNQNTKKSTRVLGIDKLEDANKAGSKNSHQCTLILTEGDSAKSLAMAGIEVVGRDNFGCFPLRGKMLNVRDAAASKIAANTEVQNLMKILGIRMGENYTDVKPLRYGSIMIMTDQDTDGSHIKGLIINFIHHFWPSLVKLNGFIREFITPIIKASKGREVISFYTIPEYKEWVTGRNNSTRGWKIKYYKGLGTSTNKEAQEYFSNIQRHKIDFLYENDKDDECIELAFNKKKAHERKAWLNAFDQNSPPLNLDIDQLTYQDFINKELVLFSIEDNQRSIPSLCDGLKPSERKILFSCFKRNLNEEIKVAQLIGYVGEHSAYHHGEQSLASTIVAMSQNFVGSNNLNLLLPLGQFGTRNQGGKDCASSRYIFTNISKVTRHLFNKNDLPLMNYIVEEGQKIEPTWYLPIIPLILINGTEGIGTGWATNIPCFNPHDIAESIRSKIKTGSFTPLTPWYKGFTGAITPTKKANVYTVSGKYHWSDEDPNVLFITEIPIKKWTRDYKNYLQELMGIEIKTESEKKQKKKDKQKKKKEENETKEKKKKKEVIIEEMRQNHANNRINFELKILPDYVQELKDDEEKLIKTFKLQTSLSLTNMVLFNNEGKIGKYDSVESILAEFYTIRLEYYDKRKTYMLSILKRDLAILDNKVRFILAVINEEIVIRKIKRNDLIKILLKNNYLPMSKIEEIRMKTKQEKESEIELINKSQETAEEEEAEPTDKPMVPAKEFDYLLVMPLWNLTYEKVVELQKQKENKEIELNALKKTEITDLWLTDLDEFIQILDEYEQEEEDDRLTADKLKGGKKEGAKKGRRKRRASNKKTENEDNNKGETHKTERKKSKRDASDEKPGKLNSFVESNKQAQNKTKSDRKDSDQTSIDYFTLPMKERLKIKVGNGDSTIISSIDMNTNLQGNENKKRKNRNDNDDDFSLSQVKATKKIFDDSY